MGRTAREGPSKSVAFQRSMQGVARRKNRTAHPRMDRVPQRGVASGDGPFDHHPGPGWSAHQGRTLVRRRGARPPGRLGHRRVAPQRRARGADAVGADPRTDEAGRARRGSAVHRPRPHSGTDRHLVRPPLAHRDHLRGSPNPPRRRNAAPVVRPRHRPHHALLAGPVRRRHPAGRPPGDLKAAQTSSDPLAAVRRAIWREQHVQTSPRRTDRWKVPFKLPPAWAYALCNAA